jgi:hypothetical protein
MITLVLPFIPPTSNHTQKMAYSKKLGRSIQYNTSKYNHFKAQVAEYVNAMPSDIKVELSAMIKKPHSVSMVVFSKAVCTKGSKYKEMSLTFLDSDNPIKPALDSIYPLFDANDARAVSSQGRKVFIDIEDEYTVIQFIEDSPFKAPKWATDALSML